MAEDAFAGFRFQVGQMVAHKQMPGRGMLVLARSLSDEGGTEQQRWYTLRCFTFPEGDKRWVKSVVDFMEYELQEVLTQEQSIQSSLQWAKAQLVADQDFDNASRIKEVMDKLAKAGERKAAK